MVIVDRAALSNGAVQFTVDGQHRVTLINSPNQREDEVSFLCDIVMRSGDKPVCVRLIYGSNGLADEIPAHMRIKDTWLGRDLPVRVMEAVNKSRVDYDRADKTKMDKAKMDREILRTGKPITAEPVTTDKYSEFARFSQSELCSYITEVNRSLMLETDDSDEERVLAAIAVLATRPNLVDFELLAEVVLDAQSAVLDCTGRNDLIDQVIAMTGSSVGCTMIGRMLRSRKDRLDREKS